MWVVKGAPKSIRNTTIGKVETSVRAMDRSAVCYLRR